MDFKVTRTSARGWDESTKISLSTLEEFLTWVETQQHLIVIYPPRAPGTQFKLEIYDAYRE